MVPADAVRAKNAIRPDHPNRPRGVSLNDRCLKDTRHDNQIPLRSGRAVEHDPLIPTVGAAKEPARQPVGKTARIGQRLMTELLEGDLELRSGGPHRRMRSRIDNGSGAGYTALVNRGAESLIDLLEEHQPGSIGAVEAKSTLLQLFSKPAEPSRSIFSHGLAT